MSIISEVVGKIYNRFSLETQKDIARSACVEIWYRCGGKTGGKINLHDVKKLLAGEAFFASAQLRCENRDKDYKYSTEEERLGHALRAEELQKKAEKYSSALMIDAPERIDEAVGLFSEIKHDSREALKSILEEDPGEVLKLVIGVEPKKPVGAYFAAKLREGLIVLIARRYVISSEAIELLKRHRVNLTSAPIYPHLIKNK